MNHPMPAFQRSVALGLIALVSLAALPFVDATKTNEVYWEDICEALPLDAAPGEPHQCWLVPFSAPLALDVLLDGGEAVGLDLNLDDCQSELLCAQLNDKVIVSRVFSASGFTGTKKTFIAASGCSAGAGWQVKDFFVYPFPIGTTWDNKPSSGRGYSGCYTLTLYAHPLFDGTYDQVGKEFDLNDSHALWHDVSSMTMIG